MKKSDFVNSLYRNVDISLYLECPRYTKRLWERHSVKDNVFSTADYTIKLEDPIELFLQEISNQDDERYLESLKEYFLNNTVKKLNPSENLKLSLISVMYQFNKNDFDNYKAFLDDIMGMKIDPYLNYYIGFDIVSLYQNMEHIFNNKSYKNIPELRDLVKNNNRIFTNQYRNQLFILECNKLNIINNIANRIKDEKVREEAYKLLINYSLKEDSSYQLTNISYMLNSDRCEEFFTSLFKAESNQDIQKEFLTLIMGLKLNMFKDLDDVFLEDSFNKVFKMIFDSDSYLELYKKMGLLEIANHMYPFYKIDYLERIKKIGDKSLKDVYCDKVVCYPEGTINMIVKPDRIIDRMKDLYYRIDDRYNYDFLDEIHDSSKSVFSVFDRFNSYMSNPFNRIKQKIKGKKKEK